MDKEQFFTDAEFASFGVNRVAYVKPAYSAVYDEIVWEVHAAEGTLIAELSDRETAFAAILSNDMEPQSVH
jgi:hypothetical protein